MVKKSEKQLKRMNIIVTVDQYDWLRRQSFVLRKPMTVLFREMVEFSMHPTNVHPEGFDEIDLGVFKKS